MIIFPCLSYECSFFFFKHPNQFLAAGLYFVDNKNGQKYLEQLQDKLEIHIHVHDCNIFMHNGVPCQEMPRKERKCKNILRSLCWNVLATALTSIPEKICRITRRIRLQNHGSQHFFCPCST